MADAELCGFPCSPASGPSILDLPFWNLPQRTVSQAGFPQGGENPILWMVLPHWQGLRPVRPVRPLGIHNTFASKYGKAGSQVKMGRAGPTARC